MKKEPVVEGEAAQHAGLCFSYQFDLMEWGVLKCVCVCVCVCVSVCVYVCVGMCLCVCYVPAGS